MSTEPTPDLIRPARLADVETIVDYHHRCWLSSFASLVDAEVIDFIEQRDRAAVFEAWAERLAEGSDARVRVAVDADDGAVGHVMTHDDEIVHLFIDPDHHGRGLGRRLLAVGEDLIRDDGHRSAILQTIVGNDPAIGLYRSTGWVVTDETKLEELPNGSSYVEHVLRKNLD